MLQALVEIYRQSTHINVQLSEVLQTSACI